MDRGVAEAVIVELALTVREQPVAVIVSVTDTVFTPAADQRTFDETGPPVPTCAI
jgi:hypothetical protein